MRAVPRAQDRLRHVLFGPHQFHRHFNFDCRRVGHSAGTATRHAALRGHTAAVWHPATDRGVIWLALAKSDSGTDLHLLAQFYALFVRVLWPTLFTLSIMLVEPHNLRRRLMVLCWRLGLASPFIRWW
jgi:hypothetical protein